jgi:hypothetical protein
VGYVRDQYRQRREQASEVEDPLDRTPAVPDDDLDDALPRSR